MGKKQWYEIKIKSKMTGEVMVIAKVRSPGLTNIVIQRLEELYEKNREWDLTY